MNPLSDNFVTSKYRIPCRLSFVCIKDRRQGILYFVTSKYRIPCRLSFIHTKELPAIFSIFHRFFRLCYFTKESFEGVKKQCTKADPNESKEDYN